MRGRVWTLDLSIEVPIKTELPYAFGGPWPLQFFFKTSQIVGKTKSTHFELRASPHKMKRFPPPPSPNTSVIKLSPVHIKSQLFNHTINSFCLFHSSLKPDSHIHVFFFLNHILYFVPTFTVHLYHFLAVTF